MDTHQLSLAQQKWLKILRLSSLVVLITGALPSLAVFELTQEPWRLFFDALTWPMNNDPANFTAGERQLSAVLGGVLCGWSILLYQLASPKIFNASIRKLMMTSVWVWFVIDSGGSILADIRLNAVSNLVFLLILIIPLHVLKTVR